MDSIGQQIASARESQGLTQAQLAERIPCNPQTVSNWENGRRQPRYADLLRLAELLQRPVSWFLGEPAADDGWRQVTGGLDRVREELARLQTLVDARADSPPTALAAGGDRLVPVVGQVAPGARAEIVRGECGWVRLSRELSDGVSVLRVTGDVLYPLVQTGDLVGVAPATAAVAGQLVAARDESGQEVLRRLGVDGRLEAVNPDYAPLSGSYHVVGVVRWQLRDFGGLADPAAEAEGRLAALEQAEQQVEAAEARIERGEGQWSDLQALCESLRTEAELLRPVYGVSVVRSAARALARSARSFAERGRYTEAAELARGADQLYDSVERLGERSRDALNNLYNLSQLALFLGDVDEARRTALVAAECGDWTVRWKALKNLAEIRVSYLAEPVGADVCAEVIALAREHLAAEPVQANLALSVAYEIRGNAAFAAGDLLAARAAADEQIAAASAAAMPYRLANAWLDSAQYAVASGDTAAALASLEQARLLAQAQDLGDHEAMRQAHLAAALARRGEVPAARRALFSAARQAAAVGSARARLMVELAGMDVARAADDPVALQDHGAAARALAGEQGLRAYLAVVDRQMTGD